MATEVALDVSSLVGKALGAVVGLFKSKKHYAVYYWETANNTWIFAYTGQKPKAAAVEKELKSRGFKTAFVRDKNNTAQPPKNPPSGVELTPTGGTMNWFMIVAVVGVIGIVLFMILKRKRKR